MTGSPVEPGARRARGCEPPGARRLGLLRRIVRGPTWSVPAGLRRSGARCPPQVLSSVPHELRHRPGGLREEFFVHDQVSPEDRVRLVPGDLHRDRLRDSGADQVAHGGAAKVVEQPPAKPRGRARALPGAPQLLDRAAAPVEHRRADRSVALFPARDLRSLTAEKPLDPGVVAERKDAGLPTLGSPEPDELVLPVNVAPLELEGFARPPTGQVQELDQVARVGRQLLKDSLHLLALEKDSARRRTWRLGSVRLRLNR